MPLCLIPLWLPPPITYCRRILRQRHVIAAEGDDKQRRLNAVEAAEPLPPLAALAPDIIQPVDKQGKIHSRIIQPVSCFACYLKSL